MAFSLYASTGDTTTQLNDGLPFRFESVEGLGGGGVMRHEQHGPLQDGATDLGYRLQPRIVVLNLIFTATSDSELDGYRDDLMAAFAPLGDISTFLSVQRDDDEIRTLTCHRVDDIEIAIAPELRPGYTHRATLRLRAAKPLLKANDVTSGTATFTGMGSWWTAGGIMSGNRTHTEYPAIGTTNLSATATGDWGVAFVTAKDVSGESAAYAWSGDGYEVFRRNSLGSVFIQNLSPSAYGTPWPGETGYNYHLVENRAGTLYWRYWDGSALVPYVNTVTAGTIDYDIDFNTRIYWRHNVVSGTQVWQPEIPKAAVYFGANSTDAYSTLARYMLDIVQGSITLVNDGDVNAYPVISLRGPLADPVIVNQTIGGTIDLTGGTIVSGETWTIDLRDGNKRIYDQNGNSVMGSVTTTPIGMADFTLAPAPIATGGTNVIVMTPGSVGSAAVFTAQIQNRYMSF